MSIFSGLTTTSDRMLDRRGSAVPVNDSATPVESNQGPPPASPEHLPERARADDVTVPWSADPELQTRALQAAVAAGGIVRLASDRTYRLTAPLVVTGNTTIVGAAGDDGTITTHVSPAPDADILDGVLVVAERGRLTLVLVAVSGGHRYGLVNTGRTVLRSSAIQKTGGGWNPAGILNEADGRLALMTFSSSSENEGHGIINRGELIAESARISLNTTPLTGQGGFDGGGIWCAKGSSTTVRAGTDIWLNTARVGGGIFADHGADLRLEQVDLQLNTARRRGGALYVEAGTHASVDQCVFAGNSATGAAHEAGDAPGIGNNAGIVRVDDSVIADAPGIVTEHGGATTVTDSVVG